MKTTKTYKIIEIWINSNYSIELPGIYTSDTILAGLDWCKSNRGVYANFRAVEIN